MSARSVSIVVPFFPTVASRARASMRDAEFRLSQTSQARRRSALLHHIDRDALPQFPAGGSQNAPNGLDDAALAADQFSLPLQWLC
jgi:hypothetical protein